MARRRKQAEQSGKLTRGGAVGALVMVVTAVFICIVAITLLYIMSNRDIDANDSGNETDDVGKLENQLKEIFPQELEYVPTPRLNDAEAFAHYETKDTYYRECVIVRSDGNEKTERTLRILREGDLCNVKVIENGALIETIISDGKQACIVNEVTGQVSTCPLGSEFSLESLAGLTDHNEIVSLVSDYNAGGDKKEQTGLSSLSLSMFRNKGTNMLLINLTRRDTGAREIYYYYLDYGYVYHGEITLGNAPLYSLSTTVFTVDISDYKTADSFDFPQAN